MNNLLNKEAVQRVQKQLIKFNSYQKIIILKDTARSAQQAADSLKTEVGSIVKSLLLRTENDFILCLISGDKRCSLNKLKKIKKLKDISMASPDQVKKITGFTIGGVSPIGHLEKIEVIIDKDLNRFKTIYAAAGHPNAVFKIDFKNLKEITNGIIMDVSE